MKLQRTTLVLVVSALLLGSFVYFYEIQGAPKREATKTTKQPIFGFKNDQIQSLTIDGNQETLEFERVSEPVPGWQMKKPKEAAASDAAVSFLVNLLVEGKSDRSFPISANQLQEYGLDKPQATVEVKLKDQKTHKLILGKPDFNRSFLYAQVDPPSGASQPLQVLLVPVDFEYAVNRPLSEWESKLETPEPSPSPSASPQPSATSESPIPTPSASVSPSPKASPSASASPSPKASPSTSASPSPTPTPSASASPSPKASPSASVSPSPKPSPSTSTSPSPSPKPSPSASGDSNR
ncbi:DUF4340 domain-containing protein [Microcoleus sp. FACHB-SPT15]|uniref:DUF4340 domain-containing protein n=1 Tax=Microcoleus sp. FACHB-SPT15 TaxID=2692830 RepID=UPI001783A1BA|nr:DUF4340 domain-containing protein [Microcoleus sp. FACHB-SPT15]MBD1805945.1 DUF4340 domain-containing protein [Microcoleus sp. FACHB-SPT15]